MLDEIDNIKRMSMPTAFHWPFIACSVVNLNGQRFRFDIRKVMTRQTSGDMHEEDPVENSRTTPLVGIGIGIGTRKPPMKLRFLLAALPFIGINSGATPAASTPLLFGLPFLLVWNLFWMAATAAILALI